LGYEEEKGPPRGRKKRTGTSLCSWRQKNWPHPRDEGGGGREFREPVKKKKKTNRKVKKGDPRDWVGHGSKSGRFFPTNAIKDRGRGCVDKGGINVETRDPI